jgi:hypothetical protein
MVRNQANAKKSNARASTPAASRCMIDPNECHRNDAKVKRGGAFALSLSCALGKSKKDCQEEPKGDDVCDCQ